MRNKLLIVIGALLFLLSEVGVNYLLYKYKNNIELPKVELKDEEEEKDNSFAIMLEQDDGTYTQTDSNSFNQSGYTFNTDKSGCMDINGNMIENSISYDDTTKAVVVKVNGSAYCYVYFDIEPSGATQLINSGELWESGLEGDGYRYTGTNPDNYICFGTTDASTCTGNTDAYMYRIIGVFTDSSGNSYMKLIKKEALNSSIAWNSSSSDVDWGSSTLYSAINGSTFLTNTTYVPSGWSDRISSWTWRAVNTLTDESSGTNYNNSSPKSIYQNEMLMTNNSSITCANSSDSDGTSARCAIGELTTPSAKIGLMYASDYALSLGSTALNLTTGTFKNASTLKTGWMYLWSSYNDSSAPSTSAEWTISRYGYESYYSRFSAWFVSSSGYFTWSYVTNTLSVRPVFYLTSSQVIASGSGTSSDPFILK